MGHLLGGWSILLNGSAPYLGWDDVTPILCMLRISCINIDCNVPTRILTCLFCEVMPFLTLAGCDAEEKSAEEDCLSLVRTSLLYLIPEYLFLNKHQLIKRQATLDHTRGH